MRSTITRILPLAGMAVLIYLAAFTAVGMRSQERVLGFGQPKRFCGLYIDCHRMVEVQGVTRTDAIGGQAAAGTYWIVTVRYRSNADRADMTMDGLGARARTSDGAWHHRDQAAEQRLAADGAPVGLPTVPLPGRQHFDTRLVFDLPVDADPLLYVRDYRLRSRLTEVFLIADEDSFLHARTWFALDPNAPTVTIGNLSVSVISVETDTTAGAPYPVPADGVFYVVTMAVQGRGGFEAVVVDGEGRRWQRARDVEELLPGRGHRWVFDVSDTAIAPMLEIRPPGLLRTPLRIPLS